MVSVPGGATKKGLCVTALIPAFRGSTPEADPEAGISVAASAFASALDGGMVATDAVTTAVNEGLAAMEGERT